MVPKISNVCKAVENFKRNNFPFEKKLYCSCYSMTGVLQQSYIWKDVRKICLTRNMRAQSNPLFLDYLLRIGNETEDTFAGDYVRLPKAIVIEYKDKHSIDHLIDYVFPDLSNNACSTHYMHECGILCTRNDYVDDINARMITDFQAKLRCSTILIRWTMMNVTITPKTFSIPSHLMVCRHMSSESRSIIPLFSFII
jgi:hypothetical protein